MRLQDFKMLFNYYKMEGRELFHYLEVIEINNLTNVMIPFFSDLLAHLNNNLVENY